MVECLLLTHKPVLSFIRRLPVSRTSRKSVRDGGASVTDPQAWRALSPLHLVLSRYDLQLRF